MFNVNPQSLARTTAHDALRGAGIDAASKVTNISPAQLNALVDVAERFANRDIAGAAAGIGRLAGMPKGFSDFVGSLTSPAKALGFAANALGISGFAQKMGLGGLVDAIGKFSTGYDALTGIPGAVIGEMLKGNFKGIPGVVKDRWNQAVTAAKEAVKGVKDFGGKIGGALSGIGKSIGGALKGIGGALKGMASKVGGMFGGKKKSSTTSKKGSSSDHTGGLSKSGSKSKSSSKGKSGKSSKSGSKGNAGDGGHSGGASKSGGGKSGGAGKSGGGGSKSGGSGKSK